MPKCPDCKGVLEKKYDYVEMGDEERDLAYPYYYCPACKQEYEAENVEEE